MSFKKNIEIAVHISKIHLKQLHQVGWAQYRLKITYKSPIFKHKLPFIASNIAFLQQKRSICEQPHISNDSYHCYSSTMKVGFINQSLEENVTYYFKGYVDVSLAESAQLSLNVDLLFSQKSSSVDFVLLKDFKVIKTYSARIRKIHGLFSFFSVDFDRFGVLKMQGIYQALLLEYKFQSSEDDSQYIGRQFSSIYDYIEYKTNDYKLTQTSAFYSSYRGTLEDQLKSLQELYNKLLKICPKKSIDYSKYSKLNSNKKIESLLGDLERDQAGKVSEKQKILFVQLVLQDILNLKVLLHKVWIQVNQFVRENLQQISQFFRKQYQENLRNRLECDVLRCRIKNQDWTFTRNSDNKTNLEQIKSARKLPNQSLPDLWDQIFQIEGENEFQVPEKSIKIFEEIYETGILLSPKPVSEKYMHLIVLVHGFQAQRNDLVFLKQSLEAHHRTKVVISVANMGKTEDSLDICGRRFASEIEKMLQIFKGEIKLSFIGHSMGGLIIRSALRFLSQHKKKFHAFVSICSPHLGYLYSTSRLVHAGLWLLNTFQKSESIREICLRDKENLRDCFLYKLSEGGLLDSFQKIAFLASSQDQYVPFQSARVQKNPSLLMAESRSRQQTEVICQMVDNMLCQVETSEVHRLNVVFHIQQNSLDSFLGRIGHVLFLNDAHFIRHLTITLDHLFT